MDGPLRGTVHPPAVTNTLINDSVRHMGKRSGADCLETAFGVPWVICPCATVSRPGPAATHTVCSERFAQDEESGPKLARSGNADLAGRVPLLHIGFAPSPAGNHG